MENQNPDKQAEIYKLLSAPLPQNAIQFTSKEKTKKGYDMTGYSYQFVVNRLNEVLGPLNWSTKEEFEIVKAANPSAFKKWETTCKIELTICINGLAVTRTAWGGSGNAEKVDSVKGAWTQALKRAASLFGVGKEAYEGTIDPEFLGQEEEYSDERVYNKATYVHPPKSEYDPKAVVPKPLNPAPENKPRSEQKQQPAPAPKPKQLLSPASVEKLRAAREGLQITTERMLAIMREAGYEYQFMSDADVAPALLAVEKAVMPPLVKDGEK